MEIFASYDSPLGPLLLVSDGTALTGLYMNRQIPAQATANPVFDSTKSWLDSYFQGISLPMDFPIRARGTPFQELIWSILLTIPYGETRTYGSIARQAAAALGKERMSSQAVGQAVGKNPVSILIPCHRCIGSNGALTGYAGGIHNKQWLLSHERQLYL